MSRILKFRVWSEKDNTYIKVGAIVVNTGIDTEFTDKGAKYIVEQYTGLKDKNGKEIYEGDIMRYDAIDYKVLWSDYYASFETKRINSEYLNEGLTLHFLARVGRVISNIHENPELLETSV